MSASPLSPYLNVFTVKEFEAKDGTTARNWTKVGVAFPHTEAEGFNIELQCVPLDGKLVVLPPHEVDQDTAAASAQRANGEAERGSAPKPPQDRTARETRNSSRSRRR